MTAPRVKAKPIIVNSDETLAAAGKALLDLYIEHRYLRITFKTGKDRSLDQNAISHAWYQQIARDAGEMLPIQAKALCKLHYGVPILRAEDEDFRRFYDSAVKPLTYQQKLEIMEKEFCPVTSLMTTAQMTRYLEDVQKGFAGRVALEFPPEE